MISRALISVSDKTGIVTLGEGLKKLGVEIVSTGGTAALLREHEIDVVDVSAVTEFPECLDGRVKTLHPHVHAGLLADRSKKEHMDFLASRGIRPFDLVVVNLYPFKETIQKLGVGIGECIEQIDIGGPTMLRSAAKNYASVAVITDPADYAEVLSTLKKEGEFSKSQRFRWMAKTFAHTAAYDALIAEFMRSKLADYSEDEPDAADVDAELIQREDVTTDESLFPAVLTQTWERRHILRYGENPHQRAVFYQEPVPPTDSLARATKLHGKALSYNNIADTDAAIRMVQGFEKTACVAVKHANPCGVAVRDTAGEAWEAAYEADPVSVFGGIVAFNCPVDLRAAEGMSKIFLEVIVAPDFEPEALELLSKKKNIRLLRLSGLDATQKGPAMIYKPVHGGLLVQEPDRTVYEEDQLQFVTKVKPNPLDLADCYFGMQVVKTVKSNAIVLVKDCATVGIGPGQVNRITALEIAIKMAGDKAAGSVLASDAFFPFDDCVRTAAAAGIKTIIQPGGSIRDEDSIKACDELGLAMIFTGARHFLH